MRIIRFLFVDASQYPGRRGAAAPDGSAKIQLFIVLLGFLLLSLVLLIALG